MTYSRHDITETYHLMGYPEAQIEQIQKMGLLAGNNMTWLTLLSALPLLGSYLTPHPKDTSAGIRKDGDYLRHPPQDASSR